MKAHKPNTDQEAWAKVYVNGQPCTEYVLPTGTETSNPNELHCFIPVSDGDRVIVKGGFEGTILHGAIDLLADGSYLRDNRYEGAKSGSVAAVKRDIKFEKVLDNPIPPDHTSIYPPPVVVEGELHTKKLTQPVQHSRGGTELGVGSLAVVINVNQKSTSQYRTEARSLTCGDWKRKDSTNTSNAGIAPTHELEVRVTDPLLHLNRQSKHKRHSIQTRFGTKPWATFVFHYRSRAALESYGCVIRPDTDHALEAYKGNDFIFGDVEKARKPKEKRPNEGMNSSAVEDQISVALGANTRDRNDSLFMTPAPQAMPPQKKQKLFGASLFQRAQPVETCHDGHEDFRGGSIEDESTEDLSIVPTSIENVPDAPPSIQQLSFEEHMPNATPNNHVQSEKTVGEEVFQFTTDEEIADFVEEATPLTPNVQLNHQIPASPVGIPPAIPPIFSAQPNIAASDVLPARATTMNHTTPVVIDTTEASVKEESPEPTSQAIRVPSGAYGLHSTNATPAMLQSNPSTSTNISPVQQAGTPHLHPANPSSGPISPASLVGEKRSRPPSEGTREGTPAKKVAEGSSVQKARESTPARKARQAKMERLKAMQAQKAQKMERNAAGRKNLEQLEEERDRKEDEMMDREMEKIERENAMLDDDYAEVEREARAIREGTAAMYGMEMDE